MDQWERSAHHQAVLQNLSKEDRQKIVRMWVQGLAFSSFYPPFMPPKPCPVPMTTGRLGSLHTNPRPKHLPRALPT